MSVDRSGLIEIAEQCVVLVAERFGERLDWTIDSLGRLDHMCAQLLAEGPLSTQRFDVWWKVIGAYLGEVVIRTYDGVWVEHEQAAGAYAVSVLGVTGLPFATTARVLQGEDFKSLASFARSLPAIAARASQTEDHYAGRVPHWLRRHTRR